MRALRIAVVLGVVLLCPAAHAFKEAGHRAIEAEAYRTLLDRDRANTRTCAAARPASEVNTAQSCAPGIIPTLIAHGVLKPPDRPKPAGYAKEHADYTVEGLVVHSHMPDHTMERQFHKDRQCFHFNARGGHFAISCDKRFDADGDGVPRGLSEDAYVECVGLADALLRNVLYDPIGSNARHVGTYALMHMIADSFSEAHVARNVKHQIVYLKPWNLRTWARYFFAWGGPAAPHEHFSGRHHQMSDGARDYGYLIGPTDADFERKAKESAYRHNMTACLAAVTRQLGSGERVNWEDLQSNIVVPGVCLSDSGKRAAAALADLLVLIAETIPQRKNVGGDAEKRSARVKVVPGFGKRWLEYRRAHLAHVSARLTTTMDTATMDSTKADSATMDSAKADSATQKSAAHRYMDRFEVGRDVRNDTVYPTHDLFPKAPKTAGIGLSTEMAPGTPLWIGYDSFIGGDSSESHTLRLMNFVGWGFQVRLPLDDERGERPVGVAWDPGVTFPVSVLNLLHLQSNAQIFVGARARVEYVATSVFEGTTRHVWAAGFGGISLDAVYADTFWLSLDAPRSMGEYDSWTGKTRSRGLRWSVSAGGALDAF